MSFTIPFILAASQRALSTQLPSTALPYAGLYSREDDGLTSSNPHNVAGAQAVNRSSVAALAFLVWDIMITMSDEVTLIWPKVWSSTKLLYFFVRYFGLLVEISILFVGTELTPEFHFTNHDCFIWQVWQGVAAVALQIGVDIILMLRLYALYNGSRKVFVALAVCFIIEIAGVVTSLVIALPGVTYDAICSVTSAPPGLLVYGVFAIVFQGVLFGFMSVQFVKTIRAGWGRTQLINVMMRDGIWAFTLIFGILLLQASLYLIPNHGPFTGVFYGWMLTAFSFAGYRILMSTQSLAPQHSGSRFTSSSRMTSTHMDFASRLQFRNQPERSNVDGDDDDDTPEGQGSLRNREAQEFEMHARDAEAGPSGSADTSPPLSSSQQERDIGDRVHAQHMHGDDERTRTLDIV